MMVPGVPRLSGTGSRILLADGNGPANINPTTGKGAEWGEAAPIGLLVIVLLCVAVYFLVKSMNRNIKKVPESFAPVPVGGGSVGVGVASEVSSDQAAVAVPDPNPGSGSQARATEERPNLQQ